MRLFNFRNQNNEQVRLEKTLKAIQKAMNKHNTKISIINNNGQTILTIRDNETGKVLPLKALAYK